MSVPHVQHGQYHINPYLTGVDIIGAKPAGTTMSLEDARKLVEASLDTLNSQDGIHIEELTDQLLNIAGVLDEPWCPDPLPPDATALLTKVAASAQSGDEALVGAAQMIDYEMIGVPQMIDYEMIGAPQMIDYEMIGAAVDVEALAQRFDTLPKTNRTVWSMWVEHGHGMDLAKRIAASAQNILNQSIVPTTEFAFHDSVQAFAKRAQALSDKVTAQPLNDSPSPIWGDVKAYFVDGGRLANTLDGVLDQSVKWTDVKQTVTEAAKGAAHTVTVTTGLLVGGAVVLGLGIVYGLYKAIASPTGATLAGAYLGARR